MSQILQNVDVSGSNQRSVCKIKRVLGLDQSNSEKVAEITLPRPGIQPCSLLGWGMIFLIPIILEFCTKLLEKSKNHICRNRCSFLRCKHGLYLTGEQKLDKPAKNWESTEVQYRTELELAEVKEKWGKMTRKERNRKENTIKWQYDPKQARCNHLKKNYNIFIWGEISR